MNSPMKLLEAIGQIQDDYILDAHKTAPASSHKKLALLAAIAAALLLLAGCAAFAWNWYAEYFSTKNQKHLSDSQIQYLEEHTQAYGENQTYGGYTAELKSVISEGNWAYVTLGITAPKSVDFSPIFDPESGERISLDGLFVKFSENKLPSNLSYDVLEDGDGKNNTLNIVLKINTVIVSQEEGPSEAKLPCTISFSGITHWGYDREMEQQLLKEQYPGQETVTEYILSGPDVGKIHPQTVLARGEWNFQPELSVKAAENSTISLITEPVTTIGLTMRQGENEFEDVWAIEPVILNSITMDTFGLTVTFEAPNPIRSTDSLFLDFAGLCGTPLLDIDPDQTLYLVLKDGTEIHFFQSEGAKDTAHLSADSPIILEDVDYLQLPDGTRIDGNVIGSPSSLPEVSPETTQP